MLSDQGGIGTHGALGEGWLREIQGGMGIDEALGMGWLCKNHGWSIYEGISALPDSLGDFRMHE